MNEKTLKEELIYKGKILNLKKVDVLSPSDPSFFLKIIL